MPIDYSQYHPDWHAVSRFVRRVRAMSRCECHGECGLAHHGDDGLGRCIEVNGEPAQHFNGKVVLTVTHLRHNPMSTDLEHLSVNCQAGHLRYDAPLHKRQGLGSGGSKKRAREDSDLRDDNKNGALTM